MWRYGEEPAPCPRQLHSEHPLAPHHPPPRPDTPLVLVPAHFSEADVEAQRGQATGLASHSTPRRGPRMSGLETRTSAHRPPGQGGPCAPDKSHTRGSRRRAGPASFTAVSLHTCWGKCRREAGRDRGRSAHRHMRPTGPGSGGVPCGASWAPERIWGRGQTSHSTSRTHVCTKMLRLICPKPPG